MHGGKYSHRYSSEVAEQHIRLIKRTVTSIISYVILQSKAYSSPRKNTHSLYSPIFSASALDTPTPKYKLVSNPLSAMVKSQGILDTAILGRE